MKPPICSFLQPLKARLCQVWQLCLLRPSLRTHPLLRPLQFFTSKRLWKIKVLSTKGSPSYLDSSLACLDENERSNLFLFYIILFPNFFHFDESTGNDQTCFCCKAVVLWNMRITRSLLCKICWHQGPILSQIMAVSGEGYWVWIPGDPRTVRVENSFPDSGQRWQLGKSEDLAGTDTDMESQENEWVLDAIKGKSWGGSKYPHSF